MLASPGIDGDAIALRRPTPRLHEEGAAATPHIGDTGRLIARHTLSSPMQLSNAVLPSVVARAVTEATGVVFRREQGPGRWNRVDAGHAYLAESIARDAAEKQDAGPVAYSSCIVDNAGFKLRP